MLRNAQIGLELARVLRVFTNLVGDEEASNDFGLIRINIAIGTGIIWSSNT